MGRRTRLVQPPTKVEKSPVQTWKVHEMALQAAEYLCGPDQHIVLNRDGSVTIANGPRK